MQLSMGMMLGTRGMQICKLGRAAVYTNRAIMSATVVTQIDHSFEQFEKGDWFGGAVGLLNATAGLYQASKACFVAGTPIKGEHGSKAIEEYRVGERVWSRSENDPTGLVELKEIEAVFVRLAPVLHLHVDGQVIGTTGEHPFYAENRGWGVAQELTSEDRILSEDGRWLQVEEVYDTNEWQTVYNFTVADHHTYFVGEDGWSIWAHNASYAARDLNTGRTKQLGQTHIFKGEGGLNQKNTGFHHASGGKLPAGVTILSTAVSKTPQGVYSVRWYGHGKMLQPGMKGKESTLFPDSWSKAKVERAIRQAAGSAIRRGALQPRSDGSFKFRSTVNGVIVEGYLSTSQKTIISAWPRIPKKFANNPDYKA